MKHLVIVFLLFLLVGCSQPKVNLPPSPMPNGSSILVESYEEGSHINLVELSTGVVYSWEGAAPIWSIDGTQIAYAAFRHDSKEDRDYITYIEADGAGSEIRSFFNSFFDAFTFARSLGGIIWYSDHQYYFTASGGGAFPLRFFYYDGSKALDLDIGQGATVSPDGEQILVDQIGWSTLSSKDGTELEKFSFGTREAAWSPNGKRIAYISNKFSEEDNVVLLDLASGAVTQLTPGDGLEKSLPAWSPDGTQLAYLVKASSSWKPIAIWIIGSDGSTPRLLVEADDRLGAFSWSPDSKKIAYTMYNPEKEGTGVAVELYIVEVESGVSKLITAFPGVSSIQWQP